MLVGVICAIPQEHAVSGRCETPSGIAQILEWRPATRTGSCWPATANTGLTTNRFGCRTGIVFTGAAGWIPAIIGDIVSTTSVAAAALSAQPDTSLHQTEAAPDTVDPAVSIGSSTASAGSRWRRCRGRWWQPRIYLRHHPDHLTVPSLQHPQPAAPRRLGGMAVEMGERCGGGKSARPSISHGWSLRATPVS